MNYSPSRWLFVSLSLFFSPSFGSRVRKTPNVERQIETMKRNTEQLILILILQCGKQFFSTENSTYSRCNVAFNYSVIPRTRNVRRCISGGNRITNSVPPPRPINLKPVPFVNRKISYELSIGRD